MTCHLHHLQHFCQDESDGFQVEEVKPPAPPEAEWGEKIICNEARQVVDVGAAKHDSPTKLTRLRHCKD